MYIKTKNQLQDIVMKLRKILYKIKKIETLKNNKRLAIYKSFFKSITKEKYIVFRLLFKNTWPYLDRLFKLNNRNLLNR